MIINILKTLFGSKALQAGNAITGLGGAAALIIYLQQQEGQTYCFSLLELGGLAVIAFMLLELNRQTNR